MELLKRMFGESVTKQNSAEASKQDEPTPTAEVARADKLDIEMIWPGGESNVTVFPRSIVGLAFLQNNSNKCVETRGGMWPTYIFGQDFAEPLYHLAREAHLNMRGNYVEHLDQALEEKNSAEVETVPNADLLVERRGNFIIVSGTSEKGLGFLREIRARDICTRLVSGNPSSYWLQVDVLAVAQKAGLLVREVA